MVKVWNNFFLVAGLIGLVGCSSINTENRKKLRESFAEGNYQEGHKILDSQDFKGDQKSILLYYLEKGLLHHTAGEYYLSTLYFEKAKEESRRLFTVSLSKKVAAQIANDTVDVYYGEVFEHSLIEFYLGLNHFLMAQKSEYEAYDPKLVKDLPLFGGHQGAVGSDGLVPKKILNKQEQQRELMAARAEILAWDSFLSSKREARKGKSVFKDDMLAKVFGGLIHEAIGSHSDDQIALQLYKDAKTLLFRNYNAYRTFNEKALDFKKNYEQFSQMDESKVLEGHVSPTTYQKDLSQFLDYKILKLTKVVNPQDFKKVIAQFHPDAKVIEEVEKVKGRENVGVLLQLGMIPEKVADKYNFGLEGAMRQIEDPKTRTVVMEVGVPLISAFAANTLGLVPDANNWSFPGAMLGVAMAQVAMETVGISFELPKIENGLNNQRVILEVLDEQGNKLQERPLFLLNPLGDIAEEAVAEGAAARYTRVGLRVAFKHVTAIVAAYATYKMLAQQNDFAAFMARNVALLEYIAASKLIEASERADTRYWSTLPKNFLMTHFHLAKGKYHLKAKVATVGELETTSKEYDLGDLLVDSEDSKLLFNYRLNKVN